tara:strand:- start:24722 stop:25147 length:426 start_codon:yes stop_codon:yes gene_type:complete
MKKQKIIEHFKDAKVVKCVYNNTLKEIIGDMSSIFQSANNHWWYNTTTCLYDVHTEKLAEIIEYKDPIKNMEVTDAKPIQYQIGIDTFERMEANATFEQKMGAVMLSIDKYLWRKKGQDRDDFVKIIDYAKWAIKQIDKEV